MAEMKISAHFNFVLIGEILVRKKSTAYKDYKEMGIIGSPFYILHRNLLSLADAGAFYHLFIFTNQ